MKKYPKFFLSLTTLLLSATDPHAAYTTITADTLEKWITLGTAFDFLFIDARETSEATNIIATDACKPYLLPWSSGVFAQTMSRLPKDTAIVIYCVVGARSGQAAQKLSDSGFTTVYSLAGGMNDWGSRPTRPGSEIKPTERLPEPSMFKVLTALRNEFKSGYLKKELCFSGNIIRVTSTLANNHALKVFDAQGKCVANMQNPFKYHADCTVAGLTEGFYIVKFESGGSRIIEAVRIVR